MMLGSLAVAIVLYSILAKMKSTSWPIRASMLGVATVAQVLFITGLSEVHPIFILVALCGLGYPTTLVMADFSKGILP